MYNNLVRGAQHQDPRNEFVETSTIMLPDGMPEHLALAYRDMCPVDVQLYLQNGEDVHLFAPAELSDIQEEYDCVGYYVFAAMSGDPIALRGDAVWRAAHGAGEWKFQRIAADLAEFWSMVLDALSGPAQ